MIDILSLPKGAHTWTFVYPNGENLNLYVTGLRDKVVLNKEFDKHIGMCPVDWRLASEYLSNNIVSMARIEELSSRYLLTGLDKVEPIMLCERDTFTNGAPDIFHVDGHHRYVLWAILKLTHIPAYLIPFDFWQPFRVTGCRPVTQAQLIAEPVTKRNY